ncbi:hypothetical protein, partial [Arsukibacterium sp.]|uniref:hypothetical protein n=1 Tax=Arsukibacterium sp. TaxID=1977258 RepID=UPI002FDB8552
KAAGDISDKLKKSSLTAGGQRHSISPLAMNYQSILYQHYKQKWINHFTIAISLSSFLHIFVYSDQMFFSFMRQDHVNQSPFASRALSATL